jgi:tetratricopeptide (TPR) repeat protein
MFTHKNINACNAILVFLLSTVAYLCTVPPTLCLWDCGEYLAASAGLGIPHPPGTPLLVPIGRVFFMALSFLKDPGFRLNILSVLGSAATVMFIYLIIVRAMILLLGEPDAPFKRLSVYCGGIVGALCCAYSNTFWFCSLEFSEQCNLCLLPVVITIWLALKWAASKDPYRDRLLLLIAYVGFSGVGMHMISGITLPAVFLFVMMVDKKKLADWRLWAVGLCMSTFMYNLSYFIVVSAACTVVTLLMMLMKGRYRDQWRFCFWFSCFAVIGFSNHLYMPIRSSLNPIIDEDHPVSWEAFTSALDRKQYGNESMVSRSFWRRGTLSHQFGIEGNMGFGGFHLTQFFHFSPTDTQKSFMAQDTFLGMFKLLIYLIPTALMLFAWYYYYRRNKNVAVLLILVTLLTTVVLAWYMNFADGTRPEHQDYLAWAREGKQGPMPVVHREVRVRDYFFNAGFMFFGMWLGIAAGSILMLLYTNKKKLLRTTVAPLCTAAFFLSPALPLSQNFGARDRHMNWIPYDFAYNLLMSCERDAVLITNGDNDTFPLWAIQEAYGVRKDVRLVNLSLLNTNWYCKQLKDVDPRVPVSFSRDQIDALNVELNPFVDPTPYTLPSANIRVVIPGRRQQNIMRVQDKMVLNIVETNRWRKPLYFALTVSDDNFMGLDPYLQTEGLVYRIMPAPVAEEKRFNVEKTLYFLDKVYRYGTAKVSDDPVNEAARGLVSNMGACIIQLGMALRKPLLDQKARLDTLQKQIAADSAAGRPANDEKKAMLTVTQNDYRQKLSMVVAKLDQCASLMPWDWRPRVLRQEFLLNHGRLDEAERDAREAVKADPGNLEYVRMFAQTLQMQGKISEANQMLKVLAMRDPDYWNAYANLAENYATLGRYDSAVMMLSAYEQSHPGDRRAQQMRQKYAALAAAPAQQNAPVFQPQGK